MNAWARITSRHARKWKLTIFSVPSCCPFQYKPIVKGVDNQTAFLNSTLFVSSVIWFKSRDQMKLQDALYCIKTVVSRSPWNCICLFICQVDILRNTFLFVIIRSKSRYLRSCVDLLPCKKGIEGRVGQRTNRGVGTELKAGNFRDCVDHYVTSQEQEAQFSASPYNVFLTRTFGPTSNIHVSVTGWVIKPTN